MRKFKWITKEERKVDSMGVMTKPVRSLPVIDKEKSSKFIRVSNKQKLTSEFLKNCQKSAQLFKKDFK